MERKRESEWEGKIGKYEVRKQVCQFKMRKCRCCDERRWEVIEDGQRVEEERRVSGIRIDKGAPVVYENITRGVRWRYWILLREFKAPRLLQVQV